MKSGSVFFISGCFFMLNTACTGGIQSDCSSGSPEIAIEVLTHVITIDQTVFLQVGLHDDFINCDVAESLNQHQIFMRKQSESQKTKPDCVYSYEETPLVKETRDRMMIFTDGTVERVIEFLIPSSEYLVSKLSMKPVSEASRVALTSQRNGVLTSYNIAGEILAQEACPYTDMRGFIQVVRDYVLRISQSGLENASWFASAGFWAFNYDDIVGGYLYKLPNSNIVLESTVKSENYAIDYLPRINGALKIKIELNPQMTRVLRYEICQGTCLLQRKIYTYSFDKNLIALHHKRKLCDTPESIETFTLKVKPEGYPVMRHTKEFYKKNLVRYYSK